MGRRGRKRRLDVESEYWRLLSAGMGTVEACREIGVGRKTGFRWRQENGGLRPSRISEEQHSGRYLSHFEQRIAALAEHGHGVREIARRLERSPSTISRECAETDRATIEEAMTGISPTPARVSVQNGLDNPGWPRMSSYELWLPRSSNSSGVRNRSPLIYDPPTWVDRNGTCVPRPSTRPSTCLEEVA
jgi:transposase-like protein